MSEIMEHRSLTVLFHGAERPEHVLALSRRRFIGECAERGRILARSEEYSQHPLFPEGRWYISGRESYPCDAHARFFALVDVENAVIPENGDVYEDDTPFPTRTAWEEACFVDCPAHLQGFRPSKKMMEIYSRVADQLKGGITLPPVSSPRAKG